ncbi:hypothetical protein [Aeromonas sp. Y311-2]|uniref:hypothetical protein n=1 Tax=Aeromonas sp. Y311-2 TaxID=2990507 RepID=UPI0022E8BD89|nr:hypothetical protein [Aeromonas sp. Y311-2]
MSPSLPSRKGASKLEPHADEILNLKKNHSLEVIREHLQATYGIEITRSSINAFIKRRQKATSQEPVSSAQQTVREVTSPSKIATEETPAVAEHSLSPHEEEAIKSAPVVDVWAGKVKL